MSDSVVAQSFRPGELELYPDGTGRLLGSKCSSCGAHFFPVRDACSGCLSRDLETIRFATQGVLYTYSVVRQSLPKYPTPYVLAYVDFPENVRIMGQVSGCEIEEVKIGMRMELSIEPFGEDAEGNQLTGYRFKPLESSND